MKSLFYFKTRCKYCSEGNIYTTTPMFLSWNLYFVVGLPHFAASMSVFWNARKLSYWRFGVNEISVQQFFLRLVKLHYASAYLVPLQMTCSLLLTAAVVQKGYAQHWYAFFSILKCIWNSLQFLRSLQVGMVLISTSPEHYTKASDTLIYLVFPSYTDFFIT